jgi:hypothetical protein
LNPDYEVSLALAIGRPLLSVTCQAVMLLSPMSALKLIVLQNSKIGLQQFFREKSS